MSYKKITDELLANAVAKNISMMGVMRYLGYSVLSGGCHGNLSKRTKRMGLDTSHFLGQGANRGLNHIGGPAKKTPDRVFVFDGNSGRKEKSHILRRSLIGVGTDEKCVLCGLGTTWNGKNIVLEVDHINGNPLDNRLENLRMVCPNCHSQLPTSHRRR